MAGAGAGGVEAVEARVGAFAGAGVGAGGFSEGLGVADFVEDVVDDLEGESGMAADGGEFFNDGGFGSADASAHFQGGGDEGGGFIEVNEVELLGGAVGVFAFHVFGLSGDEGAASGGSGEIGDQGGGEGGLLRIAFGEKAEGVGEKSVAGEDGGGFVKLAVAGGAAAAKFGVVHARKVVVDEGVGVEAFDGDGGGKSIGGTVEKIGGGEAEDRAEAFAAGFQAVAHGGVEAGGAGVGGRNQLIDGGFYLAAIDVEFFFEVHEALSIVGRLLIMPDFEQVCRRLFSDSSWLVKCLLGTLLVAFPVLHFLAFGYLGRVARAGAEGEVFQTPEWGDWHELFVRGFFYFLILAGLGGGIFLAAMLVSLPFQGWLGPLAFIPFIPAVLLGPPLVGAGWYRYSLTGQFLEGFRLPELFRLVGEAGARLILPTLAYIGLLFAASPVFPLAFFAGGLVVFYFYCSVFNRVDARHGAGSESSFSVL